MDNPEPDFPVDHAADRQLHFLRILGLPVLCADFVFLPIDYFVGLQIPKAKSLAGKRAWLSVSLVSNLGLLGFFKYWDFFAASTDRLAQALGLQAIAPLLHIILPAGISFYTFHALSYTIDIYRGKVAPTRSPIKFLLFVSFFPQLVAGPILRYSQLTDQLDNMPHQIQLERNLPGRLLCHNRPVQETLAG